MKQTPFPDQAGRAVAAGAEQPPLGNVDKGVVEDVVVGLSRVSAAGRQIKKSHARQYSISKRQRIRHSSFQDSTHAPSRTVSVQRPPQGLAQCRPAFDQRHRTKARACRGGRMIDLHITCAPCLAVFASTYVIYN